MVVRSPNFSNGTCSRRADPLGELERPLAGELDLLLPLAGLRQVAEVYGWPRGMWWLAGKEDEEGGGSVAPSLSGCACSQPARRLGEPGGLNSTGQNLGLKHAKASLLKLCQS